LPEFNRGVLESLREPLESGVVAVSRAALQVEYPARFQLVAAMNPCPCGALGDRVRPCSCTPTAVHRYQARISGPLLDRIDLQVEVEALSYAEIDGPPGERTRDVAGRVLKARSIQASRNKWDTGSNADVPSAALGDVTRLDAEGRALMARAVDKLGLTGRAHDRLLRVGRTIADLERSDRVSAAHLAEALQFRRKASGTPST
jgi:magnesium chelatase family protein